MILNFAGNVIAFIPFGYLLPKMVKKKPRLFHTVLFSFEFSLLVELTQLISRTGSFDVDDLILNTLAGVSPENLSDDELNALVSYNGNVYTKFGNTYQLTYPMVSSGDYHVDDLLLIDVAKFLIQQKTVAGLVSMRKIKQTEEGVGTEV